MTRCLSAIKVHLGQAQSRHLQNRLCPFNADTTPWFRHRAHFGVLWYLSAAAGSMSTCVVPANVSLIEFDADWWFRTDGGAADVWLGETVAIVGKAYADVKLLMSFVSNFIANWKNLLFSFHSETNEWNAWKLSANVLVQTTALILSQITVRILENTQVLTQN